MPPAPDPVLHSSFYRFTPVPDAADLARTLRRLGRGLGGAITVAAEGVSGAVAGPAGAVQAFESALQAPALLGGTLRSMAFKRSACHGAPFGRLKVSVKPELVALGLTDDDLGTHAATPPGAPDERVRRLADLPPPDEHDASHVGPDEWHALLARDDVVVLDNRNHFEFRLGHFRGAVDPQVHHFRDFVAHVQKHAADWRAQGKTVAMYCTGGIRCDKTAPWMRSLGLPVAQLDGGVIGYLQALRDAGGDAARDWQGECFVFDQRLALDTRLQPTGTPAEAVFDARHPDEAWRLARARRLAAAVVPPELPSERRSQGPDADAAEAVGRASGLLGSASDGAA